MIVNFTNNHQYQSLLTIPGSSSTIELTIETKLLGYWLTADMKPSKHVSHILEIAYKRLWAISRLKSAGVKEDDILYFFNMKIRSVLEYCEPIFTSMLTVENIYDIECVQKIALRVILNDRYENYYQACSAMKTKSLQSRQTELSLKFAISCLKNDRHRHLFKQRKSLYYTLRKLKSFELPLCHTERFKSSPLPFLTVLLNDHFANKVM